MSMSNIPKIKIGEMEIYGFQGGMGLGVSQSRLASSVANESWLGVIASVGLGALNKREDSDKTYFAEEIANYHSRNTEIVSDIQRSIEIDKCYSRANKLALIDEIKKARKKTNGFIGVNIMHALTDYSTLVEGALEAEADAIISGAGIPRDLPSYLKGKKTKLIPIVSSSRLADMICRSWTKNYDYLPDAIVVEGPMAGGHLGYSKEELEDKEFVQNGLSKIINEVSAITKKYESSSKKIPIIAAGGIFYGGDILKALSWGASGVQMATRFVTTKECDADDKFKQKFIDCREEDLRIISSPVGMPGRAISGEFLESVKRGEKVPFACPYHCLKPCIPKNSPYCIGKALSNAYRGIIDQGFVFAGANAYRCKEIISVKDLVSKLDNEASSGIVSN